MSGGGGGVSGGGSGAVYWSYGRLGERSQSRVVVWCPERREELGRDENG